MKQMILPVFVVFAMSGLAQNVNYKLSFPKGKKLEMATRTKAVVSQEVMGQAMEMNISTSVVRMLDIEEVKDEMATIEHKIKRVQFSFDMMGQAQSFDSEKEEDMKSETGKILEKGLKNKYTMMVDTGGTVISVKANDDNTDKAKEPEAGNEDLMSNMILQFIEGLELPEAGKPGMFKILPYQKIAKGQSWTDSLRTGEQGWAKYTVSNITATEILIDYLSDGTLKRTQETMGIHAIVNMKNKTTGKITLDKKTGLLKQRTTLTESSGTVDAGGQSIPMNNKVTITTTVSGL